MVGFWTACVVGCGYSGGTPGAFASATTTGADAATGVLVSTVVAASVVVDADVEADGGGRCGR